MDCYSLLPDRCFHLAHSNLEIRVCQHSSDFLHALINSIILCEYNRLVQSNLAISYSFEILFMSRGIDKTTVLCSNCNATLPTLVWQRRIVRSIEGKVHIMPVCNKEIPNKTERLSWLHGFHGCFIVLIILPPGNWCLKSCWLVTSTVGNFEHNPACNIFLPPLDHPIPNLVTRNSQMVLKPNIYTILFLNWPSISLHKIQSSCQGQPTSLSMHDGQGQSEKEENNVPFFSRFPFLCSLYQSFLQTHATLEKPGSEGADALCGAHEEFPVDMRDAAGQDALGWWLLRRPVHIVVLGGWDNNKEMVRAGRRSTRYRLSRLEGPAWDHNGSSRVSPERSVSRQRYRKIRLQLTQPLHRANVRGAFVPLRRNSRRYGLPHPRGAWFRGHSPPIRSNLLPSKEHEWYATQSLPQGPVAATDGPGSYQERPATGFSPANDRDRRYPLPGVCGDAILLKELPPSVAARGVSGRLREYWGF